jgi:hypothetical protein
VDAQTALKTSVHFCFQHKSDHDFSLPISAHILRAYDLMEANALTAEHLKKRWDLALASFWLSSGFNLCLCGKISWSFSWFYGAAICGIFGHLWGENSRTMKTLFLEKFLGICSDFLEENLRIFSWFYRIEFWWSCLDFWRLIFVKKFVEIPWISRDWFSWGNLWSFLNFAQLIFAEKCYLSGKMLFLWKNVIYRGKFDDVFLNLQN